MRSFETQKPGFRFGLAMPRRVYSRCPELNCLRELLPAAMLAAAEQRAVALGIGADRVLVTAGVITEDAYVAALAAWLGIEFEPLDGMPRAVCPLLDEQFIDAAKSGLLPLHIGGQFIWVVAPHGLAARTLATGAHPFRLDRIWLTSPRRLRQFVLRHGTRALGVRAAEALRTARPELSAAARPFRMSASVMTALSALIGAAIVFPRPTAALVSAALAFTFLAWTGLRVLGAATAWQGWRAVRTTPDRLPIYTIIVALYDEAAAAQGLISALRRLEYPSEKLQIILALEPDDLATRHMLARLDLGPPFETALAPAGGPRTKPKALNAALSLARGSFIAVFDAEDRPAADQLHRALDVFFAQPEIACVQARLTIDNTRDGWLARLFTAEYAGLFDVLLPGLSERRLPLPLGGSSNHFRGIR